MADEDIWRRRYFVYTAVRIGGLAVFFLGIAIGFTSLVREGGWPRVGAIIAILGVIDALFAPRLLKMGWDNQDQQNPPQ